MSLNIKNEETERLARELAAVTGESLTSAVAVALRERLERVQGPDQEQVERRIARIKAIGADAGKRWTEPLRSMDHADLLYDEKGLPR